MSPDRFDAIVIGGGINGLSAAFHLQARGCRRLAVVERFRIGHGRGGSHGPSRIIRSTYADPLWVALMQVARDVDWPALEAALGRRLIHPRPTFFFGPADGAIASYAVAVAGAGASVEPLDPPIARRACPWLRFDDGDIILHDRTGGVVAAADTIDALATHLRSRGALLLEDTRVGAISAGAVPLAVSTDRGVLHAERLVVAAGAWTGAILPWLAPRLTVLRQTVGYFSLDGDAAALPVWARIGRPGEPFVYGLPEFGRPGFKAAVHRTAGPPDDPEGPDDVGTPDIRALHDLVARYLPVRGVAGAETCLYTMAPADGFVLDRHPEDPRIVIALCCSGHGFKFGPLTGRIAADLALDGTSGVAPYAAHRERFGLTPDLPAPPPPAAG